MKQEIITLQENIDDFLRDRSNINVLEAGCGSANLIHFGKERCYLGRIDFRKDGCTQPKVGDSVL
jgi:hypothetical protein